MNYTREEINKQYLKGIYSGIKLCNDILEDEGYGIEIKVPSRKKIEKQCLLKEIKK